MKSSGSSQPAGRDARLRLVGGLGRRLCSGSVAAGAGCGCWRAGAALDEVDVLAGGGAGEEHALQGGGAQDASVEVGEDGGEVGGAEAAAMALKLGAVARWRMVSMRWRP